LFHLGRILLQGLEYVAWTNVHFGIAHGRLAIGNGKKVTVMIFFWACGPGSILGWNTFIGRTVNPLNGGNVLDHFKGNTPLQGSPHSHGPPRHGRSVARVDELASLNLGAILAMVLIDIDSLVKLLSSRLQEGSKASVGFVFAVGFVVGMGVPPGVHVFLPRRADQWRSSGLLLVCQFKASDGIRVGKRGERSTIRVQVQREKREQTNGYQPDLTMATLIEPFLSMVMTGMLNWMVRGFHLGLLASMVVG
jgi:hypothetical protein